VAGVAVNLTIAGAVPVSAVPVVPAEVLVASSPPEPDADGPCIDVRRQASPLAHTATPIGNHRY
jgi:hypothetical protein